MVEPNHDSLKSAIFITFSGNCKKALHFYQSCFGGRLQFEIFEKEMHGYTELPVVSGSLITDRLIILGSDLVHNEGRKLGNYMSIFLHCKSTYDRSGLIEKLRFDQKHAVTSHDDDQKLIEVTDFFGVRWILGI